MHDAISLEKKGVPTVAVISDAFVGNAKTVAKLSGIPDYPYLVLPHPVSSLDEDGIQKLVTAYFARILELLLTRPTPTVEAR